MMRQPLQHTVSASQKVVIPTLATARSRGWWTYSMSCFSEAALLLLIVVDTGFFLGPFICLAREMAPFLAVPSPPVDTVARAQYDSDCSPCVLLLMADAVWR